MTAKEKAVDNEKYAFRCFLLWFGFSGDKYKDAQKILIRNLLGSSAWKISDSVKKISQLRIYMHAKNKISI